MDRQGRRDRMMARKLCAMRKWTPEQRPKDRARIEAFLAQNSELGSRRESSLGFDPVELVMQNHPDLTRKEAGMFAAKFGF